MENLQVSLVARVNRIAAQRHVIVREKWGRPFPLGDADSIVSAVPDVRLETHRPGFTGRRKRLRG